MAVTTELLAQLQSQQMIYALPVLMLCGALFFITFNAPYRGFRMIGSSKWALSYKKTIDSLLTESKNRLFEGARTNRPFQMIMQNGPAIMFPARYMNEIKNDARLSFGASIARDLFADYPGFEGVKAVSYSNVMRDTVRQNLTQSLNPVTNNLCEEVDYATDILFGEDKEWHLLSIAETLPKYIARLSSRVFLGPVLSRNEEWLKISTEYTIKVATASRALRTWNPVLRPIAHWFIPECKELRYFLKKGRELISEEIKNREEGWKARAAKGQKPAKIEDMLEWLQDHGRTEGEPVDLAATQLALSFAAIHTTSDMVVKVLIRLAGEPKYQKDLRDEIISVLGEDIANGARMTKNTMFKMKLMDSILKETQRMQPIAYTVVGRKALDRVKLEDGTVIPKNAFIRVVNDSSFDDNIYPEANTFNPHRFMKLREQPGQENNHQFVTTSSEQLGFGHGLHACPGRFFASNEIKIALCWLLLKYDWAIDKDNQPEILEYYGEIFGHPNNKLLCRRRKEEIDTAALYVPVVN